MNELTCIFPDTETYNQFKNKVDQKNFYNSFFPIPEILVNTTAPNINVEKLIAEYNIEFPDVEIIDPKSEEEEERRGRGPARAPHDTSRMPSGLAYRVPGMPHAIGPSGHRATPTGPRGGRRAARGEATPRHARPCPD